MFHQQAQLTQFVRFHPMNVYRTCENLGCKEERGDNLLASRIRVRGISHDGARGDPKITGI
jgi:hypothetical protein